MRTSSRLRDQQALLQASSISHLMAATNAVKRQTRKILNIFNLGSFYKREVIVMNVTKLQR
jgi:hypothetical protein